MLSIIFNAIIRDERGHATAGLATLVPAAGAIILAIGACDNTDWLTITGGIVLALGIILAGVAHHMGVDYDIYRRLETLEGKQPSGTREREALS
jgi:hypothetical protein